MRLPRDSSVAERRDVGGRTGIDGRRGRRGGDDVDVADPGRTAGNELGHVLEAAAAKQLRRPVRDDQVDLAADHLQRRWVEVVVVRRVRSGPRRCPRATAGPGTGTWRADVHEPVAKQRVRDQPDAAELEQRRGVADVRDAVGHRQLITIRAAVSSPSSAPAAAIAGEAQCRGGW